MTRPKNIVILGATGSIGQSAVKVIRRFPDRLRLFGIGSLRRWQAMADLAREFATPHVVLQDEQAYREAVESQLFSHRHNLTQGMNGLIKMATHPEVDLVLVAVVGIHGLRPTLAAIEAGKTVALASKEILVLGGQFVVEAAARQGATILPVDSEHNAISQCLRAGQAGEVRRLLLTASGGPFLRFSKEAMRGITPAEASRHPTWSMGPKITIDSATLANKGLEMIEARWLFDVRPDQIAVVVHPSSLVHSMVEFVDGSTIAQLSPPSMTFAIQNAFFHPARRPGPDAALDFTKPLQLDFEPPDEDRFPCLRLARQAMHAGGVAPAIFNAANEIAVEQFLENRVPFLAIPEIVGQTLGTVANFEPRRIEEALAADAEARRIALEIIQST